jgi:F-type H+-transporting ATPase subunit a
MLKKLFLFLSLSALTLNLSYAQEGHDAHAEAKHGEESEEKFNIGEMIMHHISDEHGWEFTHGVKLPLPVIVYSEPTGLKIFSSSRLEHGQTYEGFVNHHEHITYAADEKVHVWDFSITKNVASLMLSAILLVLVMTAVAKGFKKNKGKAPSGIQSAMEPIITFIRDEVVKPNIGPKYEKYLPYMLTLFFFILFNNLLGLFPGGANVTGNIAITLVLAVITFLITNLGGNKHYWLHLVKPTGVPAALLPIMIPVEIVGVLMKPFSLMVRLFANITAGHIILLSLFGLIFIFKSFVIAPVISGFALFMNGIELLVAFLQAFIFTLLSSMYIGFSIEEHHEADHGH